MRLHHVVHTALIALAVSSASVALVAGQQPRDSRSATPPVGTASVAGIVLTDDPTAMPIRRAIVTLKAPDALLNRAVVTDEAGRFAFLNVMAGSYTLTAAKRPFITSNYGATRPGRPGTPFLVTTGQRLADLGIKMPAGAVITGTISDMQGNPASSVQVSAAPASATSSAGAFSSALTTVVADDRGAYRVFGLPPGHYVVFATPDRSAGNREMTTMSSEEIDAAFLALQQHTRAANGGGAPPASTAPSAIAPRRAPTYGYAPVFFSGTSAMAEATKIALTPGEERSGVDISLNPVPTAMLEGVVTSAGQPVSGLQMVINTGALQMRTPFIAGVTPVLSMPPRSDGMFRYTGLAPGTYTVTARTTNGRPAGTNALTWASAEVVVNGEDITGLVLDLQPGMRVTGNVMLDAAAIEPLSRPVAAEPAPTLETLAPSSGAISDAVSAGLPNMAQLQVRLVGDNAGGSSVMNGTVMGAVPVPPAPVRPDGSFIVNDVLPGTYRISMAFGGASGWSLRSAIVDGRDVLDVPLAIAPGVSVNGAALTISNRPTELSGKIEDAAGRAAPGYFVVVFPEAPSLWRQGPSRRVQSTRPSVDGHYVLRDLPGGDYLIAAVTDLDSTDLSDPTFLAQLVPSAIKVGVKEGSKKTQDLHIASR